MAGGNDGSTSISSVLTLLPGATAWVHLAALPRTLVNVRASIVGGRLRLAGGDDGGPKRTEVLQKSIAIFLWRLKMSLNIE